MAAQAWTVITLGTFGAVTASSISFTNNVYTGTGSQYVVGFLDGEMRGRFFYTDGSTIALPLLKSITQITYSDANEISYSGATLGAKVGQFKIALTPASNNLIDAVSPMTYTVDPSVVLILGAGQYG